MKQVYFKKNLIRITMMLLGAVFFFGCAVHSGNISSSLPSNPSYQYQKTAVGMAQTKQLLGIGGLKKDALLLEAKQCMMSAFPLQPNEQYINFTMDVKYSFYFLFSSTKAVVSADIICTQCGEDTLRFHSGYLSSANRISKDSLFQVGDTVLYYQNAKVLQAVITRQNEKYFGIVYETSNGYWKIKNVEKLDVLSFKNIKGMPYSIGDNIKGPLYKHNTSIVEGKFIGYNSEALLIQMSNGKSSKIQRNASVIKL